MKWTYLGVICHYVLDRDCLFFFENVINVSMLCWYFRCLKAQAFCSSRKVESFQHKKQRSLKSHQLLLECKRHSMRGHTSLKCLHRHYKGNARSHSFGSTDQSHWCLFKNYGRSLSLCQLTMLFFFPLLSTAFVSDTGQAVQTVGRATAGQFPTSSSSHKFKLEGAKQWTRGLIV